MLTLQRARELLSYDPEAGQLRWRVQKGPARVGDLAGGSHLVKGYGEVCIDFERYQTHRLIWFVHFGHWPSGQIDHINGDRSDNRMANLRDVSHAINRQNTRAPTRRRKHGTLLGTQKNHNGWSATICLNYKKHHLGTYRTEAEAHAVYLDAKRRLHAGCTI